jgi:mannose-6-phosphate isomerase-like protein (cupin superfamily)
VGESPGPLDLAPAFAALAAQGESETTHVLGGVSARLVRVPGGGPGAWDAHADGPETVVVWRGAFVVEFRDHTLRLGPGQVCVVPTGAEHRGSSPSGAEVLLLRAAPAA